MIKPLGDLTWRDHRSALWWLGILYRRPHQFEEALAQLSRWRALWAGLLVLVHALPHVLVIAGLFRWFLLGLIELPLREPIPAGASVFLVHASLLLRGTARGIAVGIAVGIAGGIAFGIASAIAKDRWRDHLSNRWRARLRDRFRDHHRDRLWNLHAAWGRNCSRDCHRGGLRDPRWDYRRDHPRDRRWDPPRDRRRDGPSSCLLPPAAPGIHLAGPASALVSRSSSRLGRSLFASLPLAASPARGLRRDFAGSRQCRDQTADLELSQPADGGAARAHYPPGTRSRGQQDLARLDALVATLPEGDKAFLRQTASVRKMVGDIAASQRRLDTIDRAFMREPYASLIVREIENFHGNVGGFREPLASEFRAAAEKWLAIAQRQLSEIQSIVGKEPTPQVFRAGDPVDRAQEAFVPRMNVLGQLERQVMLATGCPGLLIYGRRRMGKSTLLRNLDGYLPQSVQIVPISMQIRRHSPLSRRWPS